jgi:hypothetical protein
MLCRARSWAITVVLKKSRSVIRKDFRIEGLSRSPDRFLTSYDGGRCAFSHQFILRTCELFEFVTTSRRCVTVITDRTLNVPEDKCN